MGFGSASGMITSLKNNKRHRVSPFEKIKDYHDTPFKKGVVDKKASPHLLREIRERAKREHHRALWINGFVIAMLFVLLLILFKSL